MCKRTGWPDNPSFQNLVAWSRQKGDERCLIIVNLSDSPAQARLQVPWAGQTGVTRSLVDVLSGEAFDRQGDEMFSPGLYVELGPWNYYFLQCLHSNKS